MRGQMLEKTRGNGRGYPFNEIRGVQTHFSHQIPTRSRHPSFISKYGFLAEAGTVWQRGRAGIGGGLLPLGIWTFLRAENSPQCFDLLENTLTRGGPGVVTCDGLKWKLNYT